MATKGNRSHRMAGARKRPVRFANGSPGPAAGLAAEELVALYNANLDATLDLVTAALQSASRFQRLQAERGEQVLSLAEEAMSALSGVDGHDVLAVQADLAEKALNESRVYWEQVLALSGHARDELLLVLQRHWRINGMPVDWLYDGPPEQ